MVYTPDHSREQDEVDARVKANGDIRRLVALVSSSIAGTARLSVASNSEA